MQIFNSVSNWIFCLHITIEFYVTNLAHRDSKASRIIVELYEKYVQKIIENFKYSKYGNKKSEAVSIPILHN